MPTPLQEHFYCVANQHTFYISNVFLLNWLINFTIAIRKSYDFRLITTLAIAASTWKQEFSSN